MDESIALVKFSKHSERVWSKPFDYAQIEVGLKIWNPHRCVVGGTPIKKDYRALGCAPGSRAPDILVATPGRLNDHLENSAGFARDTLGGLECLVFDEADQLLDMGFRPAIEQMLRAIAATKSSRQTLLFSATLPADVKGIAKLAMRDGSDYDFVDTVGDADEQTHSHVPQCCVVCDDKRLHSAELVARLADACAQPDHKVIVFFTTARLTQLYSELLLGLQKAHATGHANDVAFLAKTRILEIHSRKSQSHRTKVSDVFRDAEGGVCLFTSDVSARGMDYPDVTRVVQFGAPADAAQYVHRLGRTARAGKEGSGCLLLAGFEAYFLHDKAIKALPIAMQHPLIAGDPSGAVLDRLNASLLSAAQSLPPETCGAAYQAWLGFYNSSLRKLKWDKDTLVDEANDWANQILGLHTPPQLQAKTVGKMGLKGVRGLNVAKGPSGGGGGGKGGGGRGGRGDGGEKPAAATAAAE